ncbi:MAG: hypothetical protein ABI440_12085 [Casimicrobiaceae bacterium]
MQADVQGGRVARALRRLQGDAAVNPHERTALRIAILLIWGRFREAQAAGASGISMEGVSVPVQRCLADAALAAGIGAFAKPLLQGIVHADPVALSARLALAKCHLLDAEAADALRCVQPCLANAGLAADALDVQGEALEQLDKPVDAEASLRQAIALAPERAKLHIDLASALRSAGRVDESIAANEIAHALEAKGDQRAQSYRFLGDGYAYVERDGDAIAVYESGLALQPDVDAHRNYSDVLMRSGDIPRAYENYEFRWLLPPLRDLRPASAVRGWQGQPLQGKRVLLRFEQGIGDNIQYLRYASHLQALGAITVMGRFSDIVDCCDGISEVSSGANVVDYFVDMASLPRLFGTTVATIPANVPYIRADAAKVTHWAHRIGNRPGLKVGLVWAGNPSHSRDAERSIAFAQLAPLLRTPGAAFFGLQKDAGAQDAAADVVAALQNLGPDFGDFGDTAAAMANLDLVITVDTSVAHLAGAMGKETWMLLAKPSDPRWMHGDRTPWYPTARLFRQDRRRSWTSVIESVGVALVQRIATSDPMLPERTPVACHPEVPRSWTAGVTHWPGHQRGLSAVTETRIGLLQYLPDEPDVGAALAWYGEHAQVEVDLLARLVAPGSVMIDVGAGVGYHTLALSTVVGSNGHVLAYEDDATKRQVLEHNCALHKTQPVTPMRRRLGALAEDQSPAHPAADETLADLLLDRLDWIKVGTVSRALEVLQGADGELWRLRPSLFIGIDDLPQRAALIARLGDLGYCCWRASAPLYNPHNANARQDDMFGGRAAEVLLAVPEESPFDGDGFAELREQ